MQPSANRRGSRERPLWRLVALALVTALCALALGACGSDDDNGASTSGGSATSTTETTTSAAPEVTDEQLQAFLDEAFGGGVTPDDLPPIAVEAFRVAAQPITDEERELLERCLRESPCDTGRGTLSVADMETIGAIPYRQIERAVYTLAAIRNPDVRKIYYTDAGGDVQKVLSNFRSLISQRVDVITGIFDFGASMLPLTKQAAAAGIAVVPNQQVMPKSTGDGDVATDVTIDTCAYGAELGRVATQSKERGTVAIYTGTPGNPFGAGWQPCAKRAVEEAGWTITVDGTTNWTPQGEQQAAAALAAKGELPDAIIYDYTPDAMAQKLLSLGKTPPTQVGGSLSFGYFRIWQDAARRGHAYDAYIAASELPFGFVSVYAGIQAKKGEDVPKRIVLPQPVVPLGDYEDKFDPSLPAGTNFNSGLPSDVIKMALASR